MITYIAGSLFTSPAQTLVNTVNTVGVMGKGIAKTFKAIYPEMYDDYRTRCKRGELAPGRLLLYRTSHKWVINFPTKRHWRQPSRLEDIEAGLLTFCRTFAEQGITSIAFPQLGCGQGGLDWESQVRPLMERHLGSLPLHATVHVASIEGISSDHPGEDQIVAWLRDEPRALPFAVFWQDLSALTENGQAAGRSQDGLQDELRFGVGNDPAALRQDDMFDLWQSLRTQGYLTPHHIESELHIPAEPVIALLASLPYVTRAAIAKPSRVIGYDARLTHELLEAPEARGVRLLPSRVAERHRCLPWQAEEDGCRWIESRMTRQLALSLTS